MSKSIATRPAPAAGDVAYEPTKLTWWDIYLPDLVVGRAFYGNVFGWTFQPFGESFLLCLDTTGQMCCSLGVSADPPPKGRSGMRCYFQVKDLEGHLARVEEAGGTVTTGRTLISEEFGWYAEFMDPAGNPIGLCTSVPAS